MHPTPAPRGPPEGSGRDWIAYCENMGLITRQPQKLGDIIALEGSNAILMTYYRNNIQHLFALPALIASLFENKASLSREKIVFLTSVAYPYLQSELFLQYDQEKVDAVINQWIDVLVDQGLLIRLEDERLGRPEEGTEAMLRSRILSRFIIQTLERYHITLGILSKFRGIYLSAFSMSTIKHLQTAIEFNHSLIESFKIKSLGVHLFGRINLTPQTPGHGLCSKPRRSFPHRDMGFRSRNGFHRFTRLFVLPGMFVG